MKIPNRLTILSCTLVLLMIIGFWATGATSRHQKRIERVLASNESFRNLEVEVMKPGHTKIVGTVVHSNDLIELRRTLQAAGITRVAIFVGVATNSP
jgi:hypothetical protein